MLDQVRVLQRVDQVHAEDLKAHRGERAEAQIDRRRGEGPLVLLGEDDDGDQQDQAPEQEPDRVQVGEFETGGGGCQLTRSGQV
jgi:hypothetical protein